MTAACTHQFTRPAVLASGNRYVSRNVTISVAMNRPITIDSADTVVAEADRPHDGAAHEQIAMPARTATANPVRTWR